VHVQIALLKWKPELSEAEIASTLAGYLELADIEGILDVAVAENVSPWARGYTHVIYIRARDEAGLANYKADPRRRELAHRVDALEEHGIGIIFEAPDLAAERAA
jgi:hypothetical protein